MGIRHAEIRHEERFDIVVAVGALAQHAQAQVDLDIRIDKHGFLRLAIRAGAGAPERGRRPSGAAGPPPRGCRANAGNTVLRD